MGRYAQTTHNFNKASESSVIITNPIHPLYRQSVVVRSIRYYGKSVKVIVEHPEGGFLSLPASETSLDLQKPNLQVAGKTPLFTPDKLLRLVELAASLDLDAKQERCEFQAEISNRQQHKKVVQQEIDAKTTQQSQSYPRRKRRTHSTLNKADSALSCQNARPKSKFAAPTEEGTIDAP